LEFGNVEKIIRALLDEPQGLDVAEKQRPLSGEEKLRKDVVTMELEKTTPLEKLCWRQNSKALWLREGDKTKFFHQTCNDPEKNISYICAIILKGLVNLEFS